jgi:hypothetical protein
MATPCPKDKKLMNRKNAISDLLVFIVENVKRNELWIECVMINDNRPFLP